MQHHQTIRDMVGRSNRQHRNPQRDRFGSAMDMPDAVRPCLLGDTKRTRSDGLGSVHSWPLTDVSFPLSPDLLQ